MTATDPTSATAAAPARSSEPAEPSFEELAAAVDAAVAALDDLEPAARSAAEELQRAVEAFHRPALVHVVRTLRDDPRGKELLFELVDEPAVRAVLALHGIIRPDPMTRAAQALRTVRPYLQSHGGDVELVAIADGAAQVRLQGSCNGCSMSAVTLRESVEAALVDGVDEIERVEVLEDQPTSAFIPLDSVGVRRPEDTGWVAGPEASTVPAGGMLRFDVDGDSFIATNVDQRIAVFRNECVHQGRTLDGGRIAEGVLTCPWHGFTFEATSGECLSAPGAQLQAIPTRVEDGRVWARLGR